MTSPVCAEKADDGLSRPSGIAATVASGLFAVDGNFDRCHHTCDPGGYSDDIPIASAIQVSPAITSATQVRGR